MAHAFENAEISFVSASMSLGPCTSSHDPFTASFEHSPSSISPFVEVSCDFVALKGCV